MLEFLSQLLDTSDFPARWQCGRWSEGHGWLHIISDLMVFGAYVAIPIVLSYFVLKRRRDLPFVPIVWLFVAFIFACGTTHLMEAIIFWWPAYRLAGLIKLFTGIVSWATVAALLYIVPRLINLRTPGQLEAEVNRRTKSLEGEIDRRKAAEEELKKISLQKDTFLAMLGHELRNPLAPIRSGLAVLQSADEDDRNEVIAIMEREVEHLVQLVDDLLDVSRIMRGKIDLKKQVCDLTELLGHAAESIRPSVQAHNHTLLVDIPEHPVWIECDPLRFNQAVKNLLHNAVKYTPHGGTIWLSLERKQSQAVISVKDTGIGMDAEFINRAFDSFVQGERSIERSQGGLGIGLTVVKALIEMHDGCVEASSAGPNQGSAFTIHLPLESHDPVYTTIPETITGRPLRVLIIEDNVGTAKLLSKLLKHFWNHETLMAHDGFQGVEMAIEEKPDLILCDIGLPKISGYQVVKQLRENNHFKDTLIVALTGYGQEDDRTQALQAGFDDHMKKPASVEMLAKLFIHPKLDKRVKA